jgi:co-chaperonin GroES (HSP10)
MSEEASEFYAEVQSWTDAPQKPAHGLRLWGFNVLVKADEVEEKIGSIYIPDTHKEKLAYAVQEGVLVDVSPVAFGYEKWPEGTVLPKVGDRVSFNKFVGKKKTGKDGVEYLIMEDKEILCSDA